MTTAETAKKLIAYINAGKNVQAEQELYADDVISIEQDGAVATGKPAIIAKTTAAIANIAEFHGGGVTESFSAITCDESQRCTTRSRSVTSCSGSPRYSERKSAAASPTPRRIARHPAVRP